MREPPRGAASRRDHSGGRDRPDGRRVAHLGLAHTQERLFVPLVDLDVPPPDVVLDAIFEGNLRIGADQIGGLPVQAVPARTPVGDSPDHHKPQVPRARFSPPDPLEGFDLKGSHLP